jgi:hypothetical protein
MMNARNVTRPHPSATRHPVHGPRRVKCPRTTSWIHRGERQGEPRIAVACAARWLRRSLRFSSSWGGGREVKWEADFCRKQNRVGEPLVHHEEIENGQIRDQHRRQHKRALSLIVAKPSEGEERAGSGLTVGGNGHRQNNQQLKHRVTSCIESSRIQ